MDDPGKISWLGFVINTQAFVPTDIGKKMYASKKSTAVIVICRAVPMEGPGGPQPEAPKWKGR